MKIHATGTHHPGIAYCEKDTRSLGEIISSLVLVWEIYEPEELADRIEYL